MNKEEIINKLKYFLNFEAIQINKIEVIEIINLIKDIEQEIEELKQERNQFKEYTNHNYDDYYKENEQLKLKLLEKKCSDKDVEYKEKVKLQQRLDKLKFAIKSNCIKDGNKYQEICCDGDYLLSIIDGDDEE